jgi:ADP-ribosylglycohydrolase
LVNGGDPGSVLVAASAGVQDGDVVKAVNATGTLPYKEVRSGGFVIDTITAAFWALVHESSLEDVIVRAVMMGNDTDTTATVAGALAGATYGLEAIPGRWRDVVHHRDELENLARQLLAWDLGEADPASGV